MCVDAVLRRHKTAPPGGVIVPFSYSTLLPCAPSLPEMRSFMSCHGIQHISSQQQGLSQWSTIASGLLRVVREVLPVAQHAEKYHWNARISTRSGLLKLTVSTSGPQPRCCGVRCGSCIYRIPVTIIGTVTARLGGMGGRASTSCDAKEL